MTQSAVGTKQRLAFLAVGAALVLSALLAGFFYTWSFTVMNGLNAASPEVAIQAMQAMNANIRNPWFGIVFFGAPFVAFIATAMCVLSSQRGAALLTGLGFVSIIAVIAITASQHVPWNEALATVNLRQSGEQASAIWRDYADKWVPWNHARAALSLLAFLCVAAGLFAVNRQRTG